MIITQEEMGFLINVGLLVQRDGEPLDVAAWPDWTNSVSYTYSRHDALYLDANCNSTVSLLWSLMRDGDTTGCDLLVTKVTAGMVSLVEHLPDVDYAELKAAFRAAIRHYGSIDRLYVRSG